MSFNPAVFFRSLPTRQLTPEQHVEKYLAALRIRSFLETCCGWGRKDVPVGRAWWRITYVMDYHFHQGRHVGVTLLPSVKNSCSFCKASV